MKTLLNTLLTTSILFAGVTSAAHHQVATQGAAIGVCKTQAIEANEDYKSSKTKQIKNTRNGYKIKMRVKLENSTTVAVCEVARDGTVSYNQS